MSEAQQMSTNNDSEDTDTDEETQERHTAVRVFASEFNDATYQFKTEQSDRAPKYTLLPTGKRANRIFIIGALTSVEERETENGELISAQIHDGVDRFYLTASRYQQNALNALRDINTPAHVGVVAKVNHWETDDGEPRVELRPESVTEVDKSDRNQWVIETAEQTAARVEQLDGYDDPETAPTDIKLAMSQYDYDVNDYLSRADDVVASVIHNEEV